MPGRCRDQGLNGVTAQASVLWPGSAQQFATRLAGTESGLAGVVVDGQLRFVEGEQELFLLVGLDACEARVEVEGDDAGLASDATVEAFFGPSPEGRPGVLGVLPESPAVGRDGAADRVGPRLVWGERAGHARKSRSM